MPVQKMSLFRDVLLYAEGRETKGPWEVAEADIPGRTAEEIASAVEVAAEAGFLDVDKSGGRVLGVTAPGRDFVNRFQEGPVPHEVAVKADDGGLGLTRGFLDRLAELLLESPLPR